MSAVKVDNPDDFRKPGVMGSKMIRYLRIENALASKRIEIGEQVDHDGEYDALGEDGDEVWFDFTDDQRAALRKRGRVWSEQQVIDRNNLLIDGYRSKNKR